MLIYVEGLDLSGKSTLLDKIWKIFKDVEILKIDKTKLPRDSKIESRLRIWEEYNKILDKAIQLMEEGKTVFLDRFYFSEIVYWKIKRGYDNTETENQKNQIEQRLKEIEKKYGFLIIFLWDYLEDIEKRRQKVGDDYVNNKLELKKILKEFYNHIYFQPFKCKEINVFRDNCYRGELIDSIFLHNYKYQRNG